MAARLTFRPPLWATVLLMVACTAFASAGFWQLDRMGQKAALFASFEAGTEAEPLPGLPGEISAAVRYRPVRVRGEYDAAHQVLLDNIVRDGTPGYLVLTPLRTDRGSVLVNRGWIAANADRRQLPDVTVSTTSRDLVALVDQLPRPGLRLAPAPPDPGAPWPRRLLFPTAAQVAEHLGYPVAGYQLLLDPRAADGFLRDWRPAVSAPDMHLGYAVQWFAFAGAAAVIYVALNLKKRS